MKRQEKAAITRSKWILKRNDNICKEFRIKYEVERLRLDDSVNELAARYGISTQRIHKIIKEQPEGGYCTEE